MKILIAEDNDNLADILLQGFKEAGHIAQRAKDGKEALYMLEVDNFDILVLDWMMPNLDGLQTLKILRQKSIIIPTIMLTAKSEIDDKVEGFNNGADDYLAKPFIFKELLARVEALYRRLVNQGLDVIKINDIEINLSTKTVTKAKKEVNLTAKEYDILMLLLKNRGQYLSKFIIEDTLWIDEIPKSNAVQVNIYNLRKKLGKEFIKSFKGLGYKIEI